MFKKGLAGRVVPSLAILLAMGVAAPQAQDDVPRNRTLITQGWDFHNQVPAPDNFNPYAGVLLHERNSLHYTVYESMFYTNHNNNEVIPWLGESFTANDDFTEWTINLRDDVTWSDGEAFDAEDVVFTIDMLKAASPALLFSSAIEEWVESAEAVDPQTVVLQLKKPGPRFGADFLAAGQSTRLVILPQHIWDGEDPMTFANFDLEAGLPVGTGPYRLVRADSNSLAYDLRDEWWAVDAGVADAMPAIERVVYVPATQEAMPQLFANNQIDIGRSIQPGAYEAIRVQNPGLVAWNPEGPVWGAPDGCVFTVVFNNQRAPFDDPTLRQAINAAIDRDQYVNLAYEGSVIKAVLPVSSYGSMLEYVNQLSENAGANALDGQNFDRVAELMEQAGYVRNDAGVWAGSDGATLQIELDVAQGDPSGPVLVEQLRAAGFDAIFRAMQGSAHVDAVTAGNFSMSVRPHCGSLYDPWQTLEHFHSKYSRPEGEAVPNLRAPSRYSNPELDAILDEMESRQPSPDDAEYMALVEEAVQIYARDLPEIVLAEEFHTLVFNSTYWTGYPDAENPYIAPYIPWEGFALVIHNLEPRQ